MAVDLATLTKVVRQVAEQIAKESFFSLDTNVQPLRDIGIVAGCHMGQGAEMQGCAEQAKRLMLEWYAGQILTIAENKQWATINAWLCTLDVFAPSLD